MHHITVQQQVGHIFWTVESLFYWVVDDSTICWALVHLALEAPRETVQAEVIIDWSGAVSTSAVTPPPLRVRPPGDVLPRCSSDVD